jgi:hypothetical protein
MSLVNLTASDVSCQDRVVACGGLKAIISLAGANVPASRPATSTRPKVLSGLDSHGAGASAAAHPPNGSFRPIGSAGEPRPSQSKPVPTDPMAVRFAGLALSNLCANRKHRVTIVK